MFIAELLKPFLFEDDAYDWLSSNQAAVTRLNNAAVRHGDKEKTGAEWVEIFKKFDPSYIPPEQGQPRIPPGKYLNFLINMYAKKPNPNQANYTPEFKLEDHEAIRKALNLYHRHFEKKEIKEKISDPGFNIAKLKDVVKPFDKEYQYQQSLSGPNWQVVIINRQGIEDINRFPEGELKTWYNSLAEKDPQNGFLAAQKLAQGTDWCTKGQAQFESYTRDGRKLYVLLAGSRKWQLHMETDQFMDEKDNDIKNNQADIRLLSNIPQYTRFLDTLIKQYYGKWFNKFRGKGRQPTPAV